MHCKGIQVHSVPPKKLCVVCTVIMSMKSPKLMEKSPKEHPQIQRRLPSALHLPSRRDRPSCARRRSPAEQRNPPASLPNPFAEAIRRGGGSICPPFLSGHRIDEEMDILRVKESYFWEEVGIGIWSHDAVIGAETQGYSNEKHSISIVRVSTRVNFQSLLGMDVHMFTDVSWPWLVNESCFNVDPSVHEVRKTWIPKLYIYIYI